MQVVEKKHHINLHIEGDGLEKIKKMILEEDEEYVDYFETEFAGKINDITNPGMVLKAFRERENLTLKELAEKAGMSHSNLSVIENGKRKIGINVAKKLGKVLKFDYKHLL